METFTSQESANVTREQAASPETVVMQTRESGTYIKTLFSDARQQQIWRERDSKYEQAKYDA